MRYERLWARLIEALDEWTSARQVAPGRIEVALPGAGTELRRVQIVMTPDQWEDMAGVAFGGFEHAIVSVKESLNQLEDAYEFLVYSTYDLVPSVAPELPLDPDVERLDTLARQHPEGIGRWFAYGSDGQGGSRAGQRTFGPNP